ncbi:MAG: HD domain-containing protein, partial [Oscillospiraceae bacterium]
TEAIALGHDLGHTPFGHMGEAVLNEICLHGFKHNEQSLRVVDVLEKPGGLNLTYEVRNGILCHTGDKKADTLEGKIVSFADKIAYINHDIDDAIRAGVIINDDIPKEYTKILGESHSVRVNTLIKAMISTTNNGDVAMEPVIYEAMMGLRKFMFENVYTNSSPQHEEIKAAGIIESLYAMFIKKPELIPESSKVTSCSDDIHVIASDYIAGMSDRFAVKSYTNLFVPKFWE